MRSFSPAELGYRVVGWLPAMASAVGEGAWVGVVYAAIQTGLGHDPPEIGLWTFVASAAVGVGTARLLRGRWSRAAIAAVIGFAGLVGWLSDPAVRDLVGGGSIGVATGHHVLGWILGLAAWRGSRHVDPERDDIVTGTLLTWMVPGLAIPWLVGTASTARAAFVDIALPSTLVFVAASLIAVGLTRLDALGRSAGVDWRRNRAWLGLLLGVVGLVIAIGTPIAFVLGTSVERLLDVILGPIGTLAGGVGGVVGPVVNGIARATGPLVGLGSTSVPSSVPPARPGSPTIPGWVIIAIAVALGAAGVVALVRLRRVMAGAPKALRLPARATEERRIRLPAFAVRLPTMRLNRVRRPRPRTAGEAYLALLRDLEGHARLARAPAESPAHHARRLRTAGAGSLSLDFLAADFQLERYADAVLTPPEVRRAIRRWRIGRRPGRRGPDEPER